MYTTVSKKKSKLLRTSWNKFWFKIYTGLPATIRALEPIYTKKKKKWSQSTMGLQPIFERLHCYRPQTKFGARQYFHKRVSLCLFTGGRGCLHRGVYFRGGGSASRGLHPEGMICIWGGGPPPIRYYGIRSTRGRYASYWNAFLFFNENSIASVIAELTLTLGVNGSLYWEDKSLRSLEAAGLETYMPSSSSPQLYGIEHIWQRSGQTKQCQVIINPTKKNNGYRHQPDICGKYLNNFLATFYCCHHCPSPRSYGNTGDIKKMG